MTKKNSILDIVDDINVFLNRNGVATLPSKKSKKSAPAAVAKKRAPRKNRTTDNRILA